MSPDVAYAIADFIGYSTPNQKAYEMLDDEVKNDGISYLDDDCIEEKQLFSVIFQMRANQKMQTLWTDMKSSEEQTPNKVIVPAFMSVCVIASLIILIRRYIKKKKDMFLINGDRWSPLRGSSGGHRPALLTLYILICYNYI